MPPSCNDSSLECITSVGKYLASQSGFSGQEIDAFSISYGVCLVSPVKDFVKQYGSAPTELAAARDYASETFPHSLRASIEGCMAGFDEQRLRAD